MQLPPDEGRHAKLMAKYSVPNMGHNSAVGSPLSCILERLDTDRALSVEDKQYLRDKGLFDLHAFVERLEATGQADFGVLRAPMERRDRLAEERALRRQYGIEYFDREDKRRLLGILRAANQGVRLRDEDIVWLKTRDLFSEELKQAFHQREAVHHQTQFESSGDPWAAVNASSHFRKADRAAEALRLLGRVVVGASSPKHLKSAVCTTRGGALRDLGRLDEAREAAGQGHAFEPNSFHPCTLLGAIHYDLEKYIEGDAWFAKAVERGASRGNVDQEIKAIFRRATGASREALKRHLLAIDPEAYGWADRLGPSAGRDPARAGQARKRRS